MRLVLLGLILGLCLQGSLGHNYDLRANDIEAPKPMAKYPYFVTASIPALHDQLYKDVIRTLIEDGVFFNNDTARAGSPFVFKNPDEIRKVLDFSLPEERVDHKTLLDVVKKVIQYSPHGSHPFKVDRHSAGIDPYGLVGDWMGTTMSAPVLTYFLAPVFTLMEYEVQRRVRTLIGYPDGRGDGMITPGHGVGSGYVIQLALRDYFPDLKKKGFGGINNVTLTRPMIFLSEDASFAYEKYCIWEGIGLVGCKRVRTDSSGRISIPALNSDIRQSKRDGFTPVLLVGVAGTPVLGAIDPLDTLAQVAKDNKMWFHVDGQLAGSNFLSSKQSKLLNGVQKSDSFMWSPDKGLSSPFLTTVLVTKKEKVMKDTFGFGAGVIFDATPIYNNTFWDNGDGSMQTTRRPDIVKIWFMWKTKGQARLAQHIDYTYDMTAYATDRIKARSNFKLILNSFESNQVAFYYKTPGCRFFFQSNTEDCLRNNQATEKIRENLLKNGVLSISVNSVPSKSRAPFFVMRLSNSALSREDVVYILDQIQAEGDRQRSSDSDKKDFWKIIFGTTTRKPTTSKPSSSDVVNNKVPKAPSQYPDFVSAPIEALHKKFMLDFFDVALKNGTYFDDKRGKGGQDGPLNFREPEELLKEFDFSLATPEGTMKDSETKLLQIFRDIIKYSAHVGHPYYDFQLVQALDPYTVMADYVLGAVNSPMLTYEDNPVFNIMEEEVLKAVRRQMGYPEDGAGLVLPGGSSANQVGILLGHMSRAKDVRANGISAGNKTRVLFLNVGAHYASNKGTFFAGLGLDNAVYVDQDERGKMSVSDLKAKIATAKSQGKVPFMVVATTGTTVLGAFDPVDEIATVCKDNGLWLHVDGAYGGSSIMSSNATRKAAQFKGLERSDSFTFNPHKVFGSSRELTIFVTRHGGILREVSPPPSDQEFNNKGLYQSSRNDAGAYHPFPDRRANAFKMWFMWKAKGREGLGAHIDSGYALIPKVVQYLESRSDRFILAHPNFPPECTSVNFYYVPKSYRTNLAAQRNDPAFWKELEPAQLQVLEKVVLSNKLTISNEGVGKLPKYLILNAYNSALTYEDLKYMLDIIDFYGEDL